ncbi:MAG: putative membrane protein [Crocinitomicaceae bacterium]|jgi:uncharacterized membrane protein
MKQLKIAYVVAITTFLLQFVLLTVGTFDNPNTQTDSLYQIGLGLALALIKGIPWLVLIPGLVMKSKNVMAWMCYVSLVYFIIWTLAAFGENQSTIGSLGVLVTLIQFTAAAIHTRLSKRI